MFREEFEELTDQAGILLAVRRFDNQGDDFLQVVAVDVHSECHRRATVTIREDQGILPRTEKNYAHLCSETLTPFYLMYNDYDSGLPTLSKECGDYQRPLTIDEAVTVALRMLSDGLPGDCTKAKGSEETAA